ncbi:MAG: type I methionyl aminopeptidase [Thermomicrobiales bacterium]
MAVTIKNKREIERMREAGHVVALIHLQIEPAIVPGVTTHDLDMIAKAVLLEQGATSSFLGHHGFKGRICASVNEEIVHGIPGGKVLKEGDIISVDVGAVVGGYHGDSAWTYPVGRISAKAAALLRDTEASLYEGIAAAKAGRRLGAIGAAVERHALERHYGLVREYGGHGIGRRMWEDPHVPNHGNPERGILLRPGMTLAIEPMLNVGRDETQALDDGWTVVTADSSLSAHLEHTVAITNGDADILTKRLPSVVH